ncbi:hypothetical protein Q8A73_021564 [Channa argus]|nr:hypothetical protein Q8A73_021564 [Channa argus]
MGAVGVLLISVLAVCLAKGSCLAGGGTNERQNSGPHRTLRDVENSIEKALRLFHSVKTEGQHAVQLAAREVVDNPAGSPVTGTAMTSEETGPLINPTAALSPEVPAGVYKAAATALSPDVLTGIYEASALPPEAPAGVYEAATTPLSPKALAGSYEVTTC